jgi:hypothetical protein
LGQPFFGFGGKVHSDAFRLWPTEAARNVEDTGSVDD